MKKWFLCITIVGLSIGLIWPAGFAIAGQKAKPAALSAKSAGDNGNGCRTDEVLERAYAKSTPEQRKAMEDAREALEAETQLHLADMELARQAGIPAAPMEITIPVVVHVVHDWGPEYVGEAQIIDAIDQMTEDYHAWPYAGSVDGFGYLQTNVGFTFKLAKIDPYGNPTNGITYTQSTTTYNGTEGPLQSTINWPREKYLNIWLVNSSDGTGSGSAYSNYPSTVADGTGQEFWDGIVCSYWAFGRTGTAISSHYKILTHEAGHWANLIHTWGQVYNNGDPNACYDDDEVADTPNTSGNTGCASNYTCGSSDNTENFMDYGRCTTMFTPGQTDRMQAAMRSSVARRNNLWTDANLIATGLMTGNLPPVAKANGPYYGHPGTAISFNSAGSNEPGGVLVSYLWQFGDGVSSTQANPSHSYAANGTYNVSLTVTDDDGQTATESTTATIMDAGTFITTESEPNNTSAQANGPAGPVSQVQGSIATSGDEDWFFFDVVGPGAVKLHMDILGPYADLDFWIYHESDMTNWVVEAYSDNPAAPYEVGEFTATKAGRYFILVDGWKTETSDYSLKLTGANIGTVIIGGVPIAKANGPYSGTTGAPVSFSSAGSSDPDGTIVSYAWNFGDGATGTTANPTHTYTVAGSYTVSLTVTDNQGKTGSATTTATITGGGGSAEIEPNDTSAQATGPIALGAKVTGSLSSAVDIDWYAFDITSPKTVNVLFNMTDPAGSTWVVFHESNMSSYVGWANNGLSGSFNATKPGRYYLQFYTWVAGSRSYSLTIQ